MSTYVPLPKCLAYQPALSVSDDTQSSYIQINPTNNQTVIGAAWPTTVFAANSTLAMGDLASTTLKFQIPTQSMGTFYDPAYTNLGFRLKHKVTTASAGQAAPVLRLIGSAASFIHQIRLVANGGTELENISNYEQIFQLLLTSCVNQAQRFGNQSVSMGIDESASFSGIDLPTAEGTYFYSFSIPLLSMISLNAVDGLLFGAGQLQGLELEVTTAPKCPVTSYCTNAGTTQPVIAPWELDQWTLSMKQINLGQSAWAALQATFVNGEYQMRSTTYKFASNQISIGAAGTVTLPLGFSNASIKSLFTFFYTQQNAACPNGHLDSINPSIREAAWSVGGKRYPTTDLHPSTDPSRAITHLMGALGSQNSLKTSGGVIMRSSYGASLPSVYSGSDNMCVTPAAGLRAASGSDATNFIVSNYPNAFYLGMCFERMSSILFSGLNTKNVAGFDLCLVLNTPSTVLTTVSSFALCDVIVFINTNERSCYVLV